MDISILLALQALRQSLPGFVEAVFSWLSFICDGPALVAIVLLVYWCVDKRAGQLAFVAFSCANFVSQLLKNIACVYRPWIRDAAIVPAQSSIEGAAGYSFPSGHATGAASAFGSFAWLARRRHAWITVVCVVYVLLVCFSRLFLGVHTPQDVLVGLLVGLIMIALSLSFINWINRYDALMPGHNKDVIVAIIVWVLCALSVIVVVVKPYPMDYVEGVLLVDPVTMQKGTFEAAGICAGLALAWLLERRIVGFSTDGIDLRTRFIRAVIGIGVVGVTYIVTDVAFKAILPYNWAKLLALFFVVLMAVFAAPLLFDRIERKRA